jgi:hypothetical protein
MGRRAGASSAVARVSQCLRFPCACESLAGGPTTCRNGRRREADRRPPARSERDRWRSTRAPSAGGDGLRRRGGASLRVRAAPCRGGRKGRVGARGRRALGCGSASDGVSATVRPSLAGADGHGWRAVARSHARSRRTGCPTGRSSARWRLWASSRPTCNCLTTRTAASVASRAALWSEPSVGRAGSVSSDMACPWVAWCPVTENPVRGAAPSWGRRHAHQLAS